MDLEKAFTFIWKDEEWPQKMGIAVVLMVTIIGSIAVIGWVAELAKRVAHQEENPVPSWDELGEFFKIGLKFWAIIFIWALPATIAITGTALLTTSSVFMDNPEPFLTIVSIFNICLFVFVFVYILVINLLSPLLWVLLAEGESFSTLVNPSHAWKLFKSNGGGFLIAMLVGWLITTILSSFGLVACLIGILFTGVLSQMIVAYLIGQATAQGRAKIESTPAVPLA